MTHTSGLPSWTNSTRVSTLIGETRRRLEQLTPNLPSDPIALFEQGLGVSCDPWQRRFLLSQAPRVLLSIHRQGGKSSAAATAAVWAALTEPNAEILLVSPSLRQSQLLFRRCLSIYRALGRPVSSEQESALSLTLANGARITSLPGTSDTSRGYSATLLLIDEAAFVEDEIYTALRPTLIMTGGRLIVMGTPYGMRGFFWEAFSGSQDWERYEVPATLCPRLTPAQLEEERIALGDVRYRSEYLVEWTENTWSLFGMDDIDAAVTPGLAALPW